LPRYTSIRVQSAPGQAVDAGRMMLLRSSAPPLTQEEKNREVVEIVSTKTQFSLPSQASHPKWWMGVIYVSLILLMLGYFYVKRRKKKKSVELFVFKRDIEALNTMKVEDLMVKDVITISPDASVQDALELMMHHHINGVVVTEHNKVRGILTETDFLRKVYGSTNLHELKVREVMTSPILTVSSTSTVISVVKLMLKRSIRKIPVVKGTELVGIISFTDAFRLFNTFFSNHPQERQSAIKTAKECAHKEMTVVNKQDSLQEVMVLMREKNVSCVLVSQTVQKSTQSIVAKEEEMGIITTKDLLEELYKNPHAFDHLKAINVMRSPLFLMDHDKTIAEAVEIMVTNSIRRLPVVSHNKLIGMITQPALLSAVIGHLENMGGKRP